MSLMYLGERSARESMHPEAFAKGKEANPGSRTSRLNRLRVRKSRPTLTVVPLLRFVGSAQIGHAAMPKRSPERT